jgi:uncharacterized protein (DUF433 family)
LRPSANSAKIKEMNDLITISPEIQSGEPVFAGTRVPIKNLFDYLRSGDSIGEFLDDFPSVKLEQVDRLLERSSSNKEK